MGREFSGKLSKSDLVYLRSRYSEAYVQRQIDLFGVKDGADKASKEVVQAAEDAENSQPSASDEPEVTDAPAQGDEAGDGAENGSDDGSGDGGGDEDLIGSVFDSLAATETEVKDHLSALEGDALEAEKARILETEQAREDREPRKGVVALAS